MLKEKEILREIQEQIENGKKVQKTASITGKENEKVEEAKEILDSIKGTSQRENIFESDNPVHLYNSYLKEIDQTSNMIFPNGIEDKEKVINALEYMKMTVNKESEMIPGLQELNTSGINSAILGEGTEKSQLAYLRDLLNHEDIDASIIKSTYRDEDGKKAIQQLVEVKIKNGNSIFINPAEYNGTVQSIEKYNNGDYTKKKGFFEGIKDTFHPASQKGLPEGKEIFSEEELMSSSYQINEKLIDKYKIREISEVSGIYQDASIDNQLKIIGLVGENLTPLQGKETELLRTVKMNDGKEIESSKMLELYYQANRFTIHKINRC